VLRNFTNDADHTLATDDLAFVADWFDGRTNFHDCGNLKGGEEWTEAYAPSGKLFETVRDSSTGQVIRGQFDHHSIARQDANEVHTHLSRNFYEYSHLVLQFDSKHAVRKIFFDDTLEFDTLFLLGRGAWGGAAELAFGLGAFGRHDW
jgi:hypothetical protein